MCVLYDNEIYLYIHSSSSESGWRSTASPSAEAPAVLLSSITLLASASLAANRAAASSAAVRLGETGSIGRRGGRATFGRVAVGRAIIGGSSSSSIEGSIGGNAAVGVLPPPGAAYAPRPPPDFVTRCT